MKKMLGVELSPDTYTVTRDWVHRFSEAVEDHKPLWRDEGYASKTKYNGVICPPSFILLMEHREQFNWVRTVNCRLKGVLYGGAEIEYHVPLRPGDVINVKAKLVDIQEKKGKSGQIVFLVAERTFTNQRGELVAKAKSTFIRN
ncbi:MaoC family dehydratase N-terminal domain-containing protein [Chloroflexota bacterium]